MTVLLSKELKDDWTNWNTQEMPIKEEKKKRKAVIDAIWSKKKGISSENPNTKSGGKGCKRHSCFKNMNIIAN